MRENCPDTSNQAETETPGRTKRPRRHISARLPPPRLPPPQPSPGNQLYDSLLANTMQQQPSRRVLHFSPTKKSEIFGRSQLEDIVRRQRSGGAPFRPKQRYISPNPMRILDAPGFVDDFYLNLLDWSENNTLAVALGNAVYLWDAATASIQHLVELDAAEHITSLKWCPGGALLAVGDSQGHLNIWDVIQGRAVCSLSKHDSHEPRAHGGRIVAIAWNSVRSSCLNSGLHNGIIQAHDFRDPRLVQNLQGHTQEVCGLAWCPEGRQLASGSNDNTVKIWDVGRTTPRHTLTEHTAAVKALAWCPLKSNLLASGGGTADRQICFWNSANGTLQRSVRTPSQVCSIVFSKTDMELVSSHGFSENELIVWEYPTLEQVASLRGHTRRALHLAQSPDGSVVASVAADETLRFWHVFNKKEREASQETPARMLIR